MPSIYEALAGIVLADATIAGLIGTRIYHEKSPDRPTFPSIVFEEVGNRAAQSRDGFSALRFADFIFNIYVDEGSKSTNGETLKNKLLRVLTGMQGSYSGVDIHGISFEDDNMSWLDADQVWAIEQSYLVQYIQPD